MLRFIKNRKDVKYDEPLILKDLKSPEPFFDRPRIEESKKEPAISIECCGIENVERRRQIENSMHLRRLAEIAEGYSEEEAIIICNVFAKKYPHTLYSTLIREHASLLGFKNGVNEMHARYMEGN